MTVKNLKNKNMSSVESIIRNAKIASEETLGKDSSLKKCLEFGRRFGNEELAKEVFHELLSKYNSSDIDRDIDEVLLNFGGEFFYQLFLEKILVHFKELNLTGLEIESLDPTTTKDLEVIISQMADPFEYFESVIDETFSKDLVSSARFNKKLREIALESMENKNSDMLEKLKSAILEVGNNIFVDKNF